MKEKSEKEKKGSATNEYRYRGKEKIMIEKGEKKKMLLARKREGKKRL